MSDQSSDSFFVKNGSTVPTPETASSGTGKITAFVVVSVGVLILTLSNAGTEQMIRVTADARAHGAKHVETGGNFKLPNGLSFEYYSKTDFDSPAAILEKISLPDDEAGLVCK